MTEHQLKLKEMDHTIELINKWIEVGFHSFFAILMVGLVLIIPITALYFLYKEVKNDCKNG